MGVEVAEGGEGQEKVEGVFLVALEVQQQQHPAKQPQRQQPAGWGMNCKSAEQMPKCCSCTSGVDWVRVRKSGLSTWLLKAFGAAAAAARGLGRGEANRRRRVTGGDCGAGMTVVEAAMEAAGSGACGEAALCFGVGSREGSGAAGSGVAPSVSLWWRVANGCASSGAALPLPDTSSAITDVRV